MFQNMAYWPTVYRTGHKGKLKGHTLFSLLFSLGTIQVLRHQRGGWLGWPNDDVWWQGGWVRVTKCWRDQKLYKEKTLFACTEKKVGIFLKKLFSCGNFFMSIYLFCDLLLTNLAIIPRDYELCTIGSNNCLILALFIKEKKNL